MSALLAGHCAPKWESSGLIWLDEGVKAAARGDFVAALCYRARAAGAESMFDWGTDGRLFLAFVISSIDAALDCFDF